MRLRSALVSALFAAPLAVWAGCSSSSSSTVQNGAPFSQATYQNQDLGGAINSVTFTDASHYSMRRWTCPGYDTGCTETGTYTRDDSAGTITFTLDSGYFSMTLPFAATSTGVADATDTAAASAAASSSSGDDDGDDDGGLTTQSLKPTDTLSSGDGGSLYNSAGTSLVHSFTLDGHTYNTTGLVSTPDGGVNLVDAAAGNWMPTVVNQQGALITNGAAVITPTVVTIGWASDKNIGTYESYIDTLGPSAYWTATTTEYGISGMKVGKHVRIAGTPPTNLTSDAMGQWINSQIAAKSSQWPAPDGTTYYALFLPSTTSAHLKEENQLGCELFTGEHASDTYKGTNYAYAIMMNCSGMSVDDITSTAAHELVEGSADPWQNKPAYLGFDSAHLAWDLLQNFQDEIGDACEDFPNINTTFKDSSGKSYASQRTWSNAAALAGHDPCVPAPSGAYFNIAPQGMTTVSIKTPSGYYPPNPNAASPKTLSGLGYKIKVGAQQVIPIQLVSDTPGTNWTIKATEGAPEAFGGPTSKVLTLTLDKSSGTAGDTVNLTVKVKAANTKLGGELITIASTANGLTHWAPILISN